MEFELAIIGTGPGGLSAALTASQRNLNFVLIGPSRGSEKVKKAKEINNYLGLDNLSGDKLNESFLNSISSQHINHIDGLVKQVYAMPDGYVLDLGDQMINAKTVIVATGVSTVEEIKNERTYLGQGISYCATCDGMIHKGKTVAVLAYNEEAIEETEFLSEICDKVYYIDMMGKSYDFPENVQLVNLKPKAFGKDQGIYLESDQGRLEADVFFIFRDFQSSQDLIPGIEMDARHVKVDGNYETNLPGLFAVGDLVGLPYQIAKAAGQGNLAAINTSKYIREKSRQG